MPPTYQRIIRYSYLLVSVLGVFALLLLGVFFFDANAIRETQRHLQQFHLPALALIAGVEQDTSDLMDILGSDTRIQQGRLSGLLYQLDHDFKELKTLHEQTNNERFARISSRAHGHYQVLSDALRQGRIDADSQVRAQVLRLNIRQLFRLHSFEADDEIAANTSATERRTWFLGLTIVILGALCSLLVWRIVWLIRLTLRDQLNVEAELRESEHRIQQMQRVEALGQLVGGVAHDFNNLLTAIRGNTELLLADKTQSNERRFELREIEKATNRAASLTQRLLAFARRQPIDLRPTELNDVVVGMEPMLRRLISEQIELDIHYSKVSAWVKADPSQLEQVVMNLVINARDAMPDGGKLTIMVGCEGCEESCSLTVADTGVGMDEMVKEKLFEPFFTTKDRRSGTGLGMSTALGIVRLSNGDIRVDSEPGRGTTVSVSLPALDISETGHEPIRPPSPVSRGTGTILLVEDEEQIRTLTANGLRRLGYSVIPAADGYEGLTVCREHPGDIDLILTDVIMPGLNGRELVEAALLLRPATRVIFMSGYTEDVILKSGVTGVDYRLINKPFKLSELAGVIDQVLSETVPAATA